MDDMDYDEWSIDPYSIGTYGTLWHGNNEDNVLLVPDLEGIEHLIRAQVA